MKTRSRLSFAVNGVSLALAAALGCAPGPALSQPAPPIVTQRAQARTTAAYDSIAVAQPANDATVFDNGGNVDVTVAVSPALDKGAGDRIELILDGRRVSLQSAGQFKLSGIARGEHSLEARVVDGSGNLLISSSPVKFHMWQASRLFPNRRGK